MSAKWWCWMLVVAGLLLPGRAAAQSALPSLRLSVKDTIEAGKESSTLTTNLRIVNSGTDSVSFTIAVATSPGWRTMAARLPEMRLGPGAVKVVPVALIKQQQLITTLWSQLYLRVSLPDKRELADTVSIRNAILTKFSFRNPGTEAVYFIGGRNTQTVSSKLSNEGNLPTWYSVTYSISQPFIQETRSFVLDAHRDTILNFDITIPSFYLAGLRDEVLQVFVKDDSNHTANLNYYLSATHTRLSVNKSDRNTSPLKLEVGMLNRTNSRYLYGSISGSLKLGKSRQVFYSYRSEDYSNANVAQANLFRVNYISPRLNLYVGQANQRTDFFTFGNQASVGVALGKKGKASVWYMRPFDNVQYRNYYNNQQQAGAMLSYSVGRFSLEHQYNSTLDSGLNPTSAILSNRIRFFGSKHLSVEGFLGLGVDSMAALRRTDYQQLLGYSYGGLFSLNYSRFGLSVSGLQNSLLYPGVYRGLERVDASVSISLSKHISLVPFYSSNRTTNNFGLDTLLNTNMIRVNMKRMGLKSVIALKGARLNLSLGQYEDLRRQDMPVYKYADLGWSWQLPGNRVGMTFNSESGIAPSLVDPSSQIWFNSSSLGLSCYNFEVGGMYYRFPSYTEADGGTKSVLNSETMNLILGYQFRFKESLTAFLNYDLAKYSVNNVVTHNIAGNITYSSAANGFSVRASGSLPLLQTGADGADYLAGRNFVQLAVAKTFNVPTSRKKLFYDLKLRLFYDDNSNGKRDDGEDALARQYVFINEQVFITDKDGWVQLLNTKPGKYSVDLSKIKARPGQIPGYGYIQTVNLDKDLSIDMVFKTGKLIQGAISAVSEGNSTTAPELGGIKVTFADSSQVLGHAFTNSDGRYSFNAPAGRYTVSLNPAAFNDKLKPKQLSMVVDVSSADSAVADFVLVQKRREMRVMEAPKTLSVAQPLLPDVTSPKSKGKTGTGKKALTPAQKNAPNPGTRKASPLKPANAAAATPSGQDAARTTTRILPDADSVRQADIPVLELPEQGKPAHRPVPRTYRSSYRSSGAARPARANKHFRDCKPQYGGNR